MNVQWTNPAITSYQSIETYIENIVESQSLCLNCFSQTSSASVNFEISLVNYKINDTSQTFQSLKYSLNDLFSKTALDINSTI